MNAGIGATTNSDGEIEHDAGVMEGTELRIGAAGAIQGVRHPVDLAHAVMRHGKHALLVGPGAVSFARENGVELADHSIFMTDRQRLRQDAEFQPADTVGAVARDDDGRIAVAVSTGGMYGKHPGRVGDSPLAGAGFYARDDWGGAVGTGHGESYIRLVLCHLACIELGHGMTAQEAADGAVSLLGERMGAQGGIIVIDSAGNPAAAYNTPFMPWAERHSMEPAGDPEYPRGAART